MNKYKATLEGEKLKQSTAAPVSKYEEKYIFAPEDFKYENKHYKYIKYIKNNNQLMKVCISKNTCVFYCMLGVFNIYMYIFFTELSSWTCKG